MFHRTRVAAGAIALVCAGVARADAQAWVPPQGEGSVSVLFQDLFVRDHFFDRGQKVDRGQISSNALLFDFTYGVTDRLALTLAVPFIGARYSGTAPHPTAQDDGKYRVGLQDVRLSARYNVARGPLMLTPFAAVRIPGQQYEYYAHAAYGTRVRELEVGAYAGRVLDPVLPNAFVQARYSYTFAQQIVGIDHDRSNLDVEFGYFLTPRVRVFSMGTGIKTHGGIALYESGLGMYPGFVVRHHDRISRADLLDVGGGVQVSLTRSVDVFGSYMKSLAGRNTHALHRGVTVGVSWNFGRNLRSLMIEEEAPELAANTGKRPLAKCLCLKKS